MFLMQIQDTLAQISGGAEEIFKNFNLYYTTIILVVGFFAKDIPFLSKVESKYFRVAIAAVLIGIVFFKFGFSNSILELVFNFVLSNVLFEGAKSMDLLPKPIPNEKDL